MTSSRNDRRPTKFIIKAKDPKHERRLKRWGPFIHEAFKHLRTIIQPYAKKLPAEITLKNLRPRRIPGTDVAICMEWGMMGRTAEGQWWLAIDMSAGTYKFRNALLHEIAHFGAVSVNDTWKCTGNPTWEGIYRRLRKACRTAPDKTDPASKH